MAVVARGGIGDGMAEVDKPSTLSMDSLVQRCVEVLTGT